MGRPGAVRGEMERYSRRESERSKGPGRREKKMEPEAATALTGFKEDSYGNLYTPQKDKPQINKDMKETYKQARNSQGVNISKATLTVKGMVSESWE